MTHVDIYYISLRNEDIKNNPPAGAVIKSSEISHFLYGVHDKIKNADYLFISGAAQRTGT
ncbi:hypothetical protein BHG07_07715 [Brenneria salicis ATCC 15712 = DSM 30166]|nr:hypothetical protein BHG07_07715 [Brenneria salicis ATCC 15712 = DSM 30166]